MSSSLSLTFIYGVIIMSKFGSFTITMAQAFNQAVARSQSLRHGVTVSAPKPVNEPPALIIHGDQFPMARKQTPHVRQVLELEV